MDNQVEELNQQPVQQPTYTQPAPQTPNIPEEYKPISMWGYFGYELLFSIPCVGFIILLVFAFGGNKNINVRNFARSYFCYMIIIAIVAVLFFFVFGGLAIFTSAAANY